MRRILGLSLTLLLVSSWAAPSEVCARKVERVFKRQIVITKKRAPARFSSNAAFIRFLRSNRMKQIWPQKKNKDRWRFEFMAFFPRPLDDLQVKVKFYDITEGKKFVAADEFYIPNRGQQIFASNMILEKPRFNINRQYVMQILSMRGAPLATTKFYLRGEPERYSGKVTFTDDETH